MASGSPEPELSDFSDEVDRRDSALEFLPLGSTPAMLVTTSRWHEPEATSDSDDIQYYNKEAFDSLLEPMTKMVPMGSQERSEIVLLPWAKRRRVVHTRMQTLEDMLAHAKRATARFERSVAAEMKVLKQTLLRDCTIEVSDEILVTILRFAGERGRNWRTTLRLSHTCARWRRLVVKTPSLWSSMEWTMTNRSRPPLAIKKLFLDRSIPALIDLHLTCLETHEIRDNCAIPMNRLSNLIIEYNYTSSIDKSAWLHDTPAPVLQELTLRNRHFLISSFWTRLSERWSGSSHVLTRPLFSDQAHQLRRLYLRGCRLPWTANSYVGLTSISISLGTVEHADSERDVDASIYDILHVFRDCPGLERFSLDCPDAVPVGKLGPGDARIPMRHLTHLDLTLPGESITAILSSLGTLPSLRLRLGCVFTRSAHGRCIQLPLDSRCLPCLGCVKSLKLDISGRKIVAWAEGDPQENDGDAVLQANVVASAPSGRSSSNDSSTAEKVIAATFSYLSNQQGAVFPLLHALLLFDTVPLEVPDKKKLIEESDLALFLWHHPSIRNLTLSECSQSLFVKMGEHQANEVAPYCPNLEVIELREMRLESQKLFEACKVLCRTGRTLRLSDLSLVADKSADEPLKDQTAKVQRKARVKSLKDMLHQIRDMGFANVIYVRIREASDGVILKWDS